MGTILKLGFTIEHEIIRQNRCSILMVRVFTLFTLVVYFFFFETPEVDIIGISVELLV